MIISGVEPYGKGNVSIVAVTFFGAMLLMFESIAYRYNRGMPTNALPKNGEFVFIATPAIEDKTAKERPGVTLVSFLSMGLVSLIVQLSPKGKEGITWKFNFQTTFT